MRWWRHWSHYSTTSLHSMNNSLTSWNVASLVKRFPTQPVTYSAQNTHFHNQLKMIRSEMKLITLPWTTMSSVGATVSQLKPDQRYQLVMKSTSSGPLRQWSFKIIFQTCCASSQWRKQSTQFCQSFTIWSKSARNKWMTFNEASWKTRRRKRTKRRRTKTATISCKSQISLPIAQTHQVNLFKSNRRLWTKKWLDNLRKCWWDSDSKVQ